jgi:hypothetical protein
MLLLVLGCVIPAIAAYLIYRDIRVIFGVQENRQRLSSHASHIARPSLTRVDVLGALNKHDDDDDDANSAVGVKMRAQPSKLSSAVL